MRGRPGYNLFLAAIAAASISCAATPGAKVASDLDTLATERSPENLLARGRGFAALGDLTRAEQYFAAAMEAGADASVVLPQLLRVCVVDRRYRAAIRYAEPELRRRAGDRRLRFVVGSLYAAIGESGAARTHFETILRDAPDTADVHFALGVLLRDGERDPAGADAHFREYLRLLPDGGHAEEARSSLLKTLP